MQKIIKQTSPSRQLFKRINFVFMKIFDFLVKKAIFRAFLFFSGRFASGDFARVKCSISTVMHDANLPEKGEMP